MPLARVDAAVNRALADTAAFVGADRAYLFSYDFAAQIGCNTHEWCAQGIAPQRDALQALPLDAVPSWLSAHLRGESVHVPDASALPEGNLRDILLPQGIHTTIALPLLGNTGCSGFVGFDFVRAVRVIGSEEVALLKLFAQMLVNVKERGQAEGALAELNASLEARVAQRTLELELARQRAESADRAKSGLMARVSHELRTPLNAVLGFAQLLELDEALSSNPAAARHVAQIHLAGTHLLRMVDDMLDLASVESGRLLIQTEAVELSTLVAEVLALSQPLAKQHGVQLHNKLGGSVLWAQADRTRLLQVLMNLVSNAIKYNRDAGSVTLTAVLKGQRVQICVADTGLGLSPAQQLKLYEPFNRLGAEKGVVEGSGLGLAITRQLVLLMAGDLALESASGQGSRFSVDLPACTALKTEIEPDQSQSVAASTQQAPDSDAAIAAQLPLSVLYVEDNPVNVTLMAAMLERPECGAVEMHSAVDGPSGLAAALRLRPDLILLDLSLPGMSGLELLSRLKTHPELAKTPCVAVSANALTQDVEAALNAGFDDYRTKPFTLQQLAELVGRFRSLVRG